MSTLELADHFPLPPLAPAMAMLSIPERMLAVIMRNAHQGQPTTRDDFHQAEETCDLTDGELDANIGAAKRLANPSVVRHDHPPRPIAPWDYDQDYRQGRVALAARTLAEAAVTNEPDIFAVLRQGDRFTARELGALWPEILLETASLIRARNLAAARVAPIMEATE